MKTTDWVILVSLAGCVATTIMMVISYIWSIHDGWTITLAFNQYHEGWLELVLLFIFGFTGWVGLFYWAAKRLIKS